MADSDDMTQGDMPHTDPASGSATELEQAGQAALFGGADEQVTSPPQTESPKAKETPTKPEEKSATNQPYRVLARKYRPQTFSELIGQEPMVRTLGNAIARDRLAHAFLMTGVRGVGKTSTARLIAKSLNCIGPDGQGGPTIDPCGVCEPCTAIAEGRHIDVIEMDAASNTGVDDVREIIEAVRYAAVSARYKIYIIDEVHMLSRNAFNALLKTLEEPPAHVKFLFATTEVDKLPVTVLSRTQRFDLRRIPADMLQNHFAHICDLENVRAEDEAMYMIAAAAEGSVRDGLSILDQAIAHADLDSDGSVTAERVRDMLGLADKGAQRRLLGTMLEGDAKALLTAVSDQYALGVEPLALMRSLMDIIHRITLAQVAGGEPEASTAEEKLALREWAGKLSAPQLHRLWQLMLKGYEEVRAAPDPLVSAQMALLRILHASTMPDPGKLAKRIEELAQQTPAAHTGKDTEVANGLAPPATAVDWKQLIRQIDESGMLRIAQTMHDWVRIATIEPGKLTYALVPGLSEDPAPDMRAALIQITEDRWNVELATGEAAENAMPSLREQQASREAEAADRLRNDPLVQATLAAFPDAELIEEAQQTASGGLPWSRQA